MQKIEIESLRRANGMAFVDVSAFLCSDSFVSTPGAVEISSACNFQILIFHMHMNECNVTGTLLK